jgi:hypothetical protein
MITGPGVVIIMDSEGWGIEDFIAGEQDPDTRYFLLSVAGEPHPHAVVRVKGEVEEAFGRGLRWGPAALLDRVADEPGWSVREVGIGYANGYLVQLVCETRATRYGSSGARLVFRRRSDVLDLDKAYMLIRGETYKYAGRGKWEDTDKLYRLSSGRDWTEESVAVSSAEADQFMKRFDRKFAKRDRPALPKWISGDTGNKAKRSVNVLVEDLREVRAGKKHAAAYRTVCGVILDNVFEPTSVNGANAYYTAVGGNRQTIALETSGSYWADEMVFETKNDFARIRRNDVLRFAGTMRDDSTGILGVIVTRAGASRAAHDACRDQWVTRSKMILVLNNDDLAYLLEIKESGGTAEALLRLRIEGFLQGL